MRPSQRITIGPNESHVDPKIAYFPALRRVKPAQELALAITVRDEIHGRPVDRRLLVVVMYRVCGGEEGHSDMRAHSGLRNGSHCRAAR